MTSGEGINQYNAGLSADARTFADELQQIFDAQLTNSSGKVWHGHPVWFIDGNPIAGYSLKKAGIEVLFWSGQSFNKPALRPIGKFKAAGIAISNQDAIATVVACIPQAIAVQWDYKNLPKRRNLEKLGEF
jgi:hypothetical protein